MKEITITDLRNQKANEPIWVLNTTIEKKDSRANIVFNVYQNNGEVTVVPVFATWIPVCLTDIVSRESLIASTSFLKAVRSGSLRLISAEEAEIIMSKRGAKEESHRINQLNINLAPTDMNEITGNELVTTINEQGNTAALASSVSPSVMSFAELMESGTGIEALNSLRNLGMLTKEEYMFVMKKARSLGEAYKDVTDFCKEKLRSLTESSVPA